MLEILEIQNKTDNIYRETNNQNKYFLYIVLFILFTPDNIMQANKYTKNISLGKNEWRASGVKNLNK